MHGPRVLFQQDSLPIACLSEEILPEIGTYPLPPLFLSLHLPSPYPLPIPFLPLSPLHLLLPLLTSTLSPPPSYPSPTNAMYGQNFFAHSQTTMANWSILQIDSNIKTGRSFTCMQMLSNKYTVMYKSAVLFTLLQRTTSLRILLTLVILQFSPDWTNYICSEFCTICFRKVVCLKDVRFETAICKVSDRSETSPIKV